MAYQHFPDSEIEALKGLTIREVSRKYYEEHRGLLAPVVRGSHIIMSHCDKCGRYFQYRRDLSAKLFKEYERKTYCRECWEKEQHQITVPCNNCGTPLTLYESQNHYTGLCRDCWIKTLSKLRAKYSAYMPLLEDILREKEITLKPSFTDGLDDTGRPMGSIKDQNLRVLPLRDNEYALYCFHAGDGILAFPNNGIGLRYVKAPSSPKLLEAADVSEYLLAAGSDGNDIYVLTGKGDLYSSNSAVLRNRSPSENAERTDRILGKKRSPDLKPVHVIDPLSFCLQESKKYFTEEQAEERAKEFAMSGIRAINDNTYYDPDAQKFFKVQTDGNYYHGYDVYYPLMSRDEVMQEHVRFHFSIDQFIDLCREGKMPMLLILSKLPYTEGPYSPPDNFGYGTHFV